MCSLRRGAGCRKREVSFLAPSPASPEPAELPRSRHRGGRTRRGATYPAEPESAAAGERAAPLSAVPAPARGELPGTRAPGRPGSRLPLQRGSGSSPRPRRPPPLPARDRCPGSAPSRPRPWPAGPPPAAEAGEGYPGRGVPGPGQPLPRALRSPFPQPQGGSASRSRAELRRGAGPSPTQPLGSASPERPGARVFCGSSCPP